MGAVSGLITESAHKLIKQIPERSIHAPCCRWQRVLTRARQWSKSWSALVQMMEIIGYIRAQQVSYLSQLCLYFKPSIYMHTCVRNHKRSTRHDSPVHGEGDNQSGQRESTRRLHKGAAYSKAERMSPHDASQSTSHQAD